MERKKGRSPLRRPPLWFSRLQVRVVPLPSSVEVQNDVLGGITGREVYCRSVPVPSEVTVHGDIAHWLAVVVQDDAEFADANAEHHDDDAPKDPSDDFANDCSHDVVGVCVVCVSSHVDKGNGR